MRLHILGICGTLMGSLALLARELGCEVSGSDQNVYPPMSTQLEAAGIEVRSGYTAENLRPHPDLVIIGNAGLPRGNAAVEYVLDQGIEYISGAEWLGRFVLPGRWVIAAAGTHGKTTTSAMVAWLLASAGLEPGFLIGGVPSNFAGSARLGSEPFFIVEADEYDTSYFDRRSKFLHYRPRTLILNNLEYDHADIFPDLEAIKVQFHHLVRAVPGGGLILRPRDDPHLDDVLARGCWTPVESFGPEEGPGWSALPVAPSWRAFDVLHDGRRLGSVAWDLLGRHNASNALAAIAAARHAGVPPELAIEALGSFKGVRRRMELIKEIGQTRVYDDFAHHPTAIATTLAGLRADVGAEEIIAIVEPGSHTMRKGTHRDTLYDACRSADRVLWYRPQNVQWDMDRLTRHSAGPDTMIFESVDAIIAQVIDHLRAADRPRHIVIMSNTGFGGIHARLTREIEGHEHEKQ